MPLAQHVVVVVFSLFHGPKVGSKIIHDMVPSGSRLISTVVQNSLSTSNAFQLILRAAL